MFGQGLLRENLEGRLTAEQWARGATLARRSRIRRTIELVTCVVIAAFTVDVGLTSYTPSAGPLIVAAAIVLAGALVFKPWSDPLGEDVREGRIQMVIGEPRIPKIDWLRRLAWFLLGGASRNPGVGVRGDRLLDVDGVRFFVDESNLEAVRGASKVRAYILPRSKILIWLGSA